MTSAELIVILKEEVKSLSDYLVDADYTNAVNDAYRETGWSSPLASDFQVWWAKERAKRHLFFYLMTESAHKFKFEQINTQQRFEHYKSIIEVMDKLFKEAKEDYASEFGGVDSYKTFPTKIDAGFSYDDFGRDTTYTEENQVKSSLDEAE